MIRRHGRVLRAALAIADALVVLGLVWLMTELHLVRNWLVIRYPLELDRLAPSAALALGWIVVLWSQGLYRLRRHWSLTAMVFEVGWAATIMAVLTFAILFLAGVADLSRAALITLLPAMAAGSLGLRGLIHGLLTVRRRQGRNTRNMLIVGAGPTAIRFGHELEANAALGLRVIGYVDGEAGRPSMGWAWLGSYAELPTILHHQVVDEVAICVELAEWELIKQVVDLCRAEGKVVRIPLAGSVLGEGRHYVEALGDMAVLSLMQGADRQVALAVKRSVDIVGATLGLLVTAPVMLACAVAIVLDSGRPIFFRQERVGLHGRRFDMLKFRTMVKGAHEMLSELQPQNEIRGSAFKLTNDPRVTRVGRLLRRTSLDELPQLWNVLRGAMSLIGPRPPLPDEVRDYDGWHRRRLSMKPGITGLWQVQARREHEFDRWVEKDLEYIDGWSLWLDLHIALRTLAVMIRFEGR